MDDCGSGKESRGIWRAPPRYTPSSAASCALMFSRVGGEVTAICSRGGGEATGSDGLRRLLPRPEEALALRRRPENARRRNEGLRFTGAPYPGSADACRVTGGARGHEAPPYGEAGVAGQLASPLPCDRERRRRPKRPFRGDCAVACASS